MAPTALKTALAVLALVGTLLSGGSSAAPPGRDTVRVTLRVLPVAELSVPQGSSFVLTVRPLACPPFPPMLPTRLRSMPAFQCARLPGWQPWPPVRPARLPFVVTGNAVVRVSALPTSFLWISTGQYLGRATRQGGAAIGYNAIMHFPAPRFDYHWLLDWPDRDDWQRGWAGYGPLPYWSQTAILPGTNGVGTPALVSNLYARGNRAYGVIYAVARRNWTASGALAAPGDYYGSIVITVTAE